MLGNLFWINPGLEGGVEGWARANPGVIDSPGAGGATLGQGANPWRRSLPRVPGFLLSSHSLTHSLVTSKFSGKKIRREKNNLTGKLTKVVPLKTDKN